MIEPKEFYRKLDQLFNKIGRERTGKEYFFSIITEVEKSFGRELSIANGRVYEELADRFELIGPPSITETQRFAKIIPLDSTALQAVLMYGSYIYDDPDFRLDTKVDRQREYTIPAAFSVVGSPEERWVFAFDLLSGWVREEIEFFMNAVRTALNTRYYSEALKSDLQQAVHIQKSLLPSRPPKIDNFEIAGRSQPAELVGGDLYDYFHFSENIFGISIGDASGHGLPAALLVRDVVTGLRMGLEEQMKMVHTLKKLNNVICRSTFSTRFVSLFYGEFETNGNLLFANAGHTLPLLVTGTQVKELRSTGMILGALPEITLERDYVFIAPESVLVLYTDGIIERLNYRGEEYGLQRLKKLIVRNRELSAQELVEEIFEAVESFGQKEKWHDDATVVVLKRLGS